MSVSFPRVPIAHIVALLTVSFISTSAVQSISSPLDAQSGGREGSRGFLTAAVYPAGEYPNGVVVGDFNGDGIQDLASEDRVGGLNVLLGNVNGTFGPRVTYPAGQLPDGIGEGDFNGDGILDIAVSDAGANTVNILLGNGDGTFRPFKSYPAGTEPAYIAVADFNKDGQLDLAIVDGVSAYDNTIVVLLGSGNGTFGPPVAYNTQFIPKEEVIGDFNSDGNLDIAVTNAGDLGDPGITVSILLGKGDGTFRPQMVYTVGYQPFSITKGDFNQDGKTDLATANYLDGTVSVLLGNGDGTFQSQQKYFIKGGRPAGIVAAAFGKTDKISLIIASTSGTYVLGGRGDGSFQGLGSYDPSTFHLAVGDFNRDGLADVAGITFGTPVSGIAVFLGDGHGPTFAASNNYFAGEGPASAVVGDFNNDGRQDIAVSNLDAGTVNVLLGKGDGRFEAPLSSSTGRSADSVAAADLNGDGNLDLAVADSAGGSVDILLGNGDGTFRSPSSYKTGDFPFWAAIGDFNRDGKLDLAVANFQGGDISILLGNGNGTFQPAVNYPSGEQTAHVIVADFNHDGNPDLAVANRYGGQNNQGSITIFIGNGDGTFQPAVSYQAGYGPNGIVSADFNGDGRLDIAAADYLDGSVSVLLGNGDGTFQSPVSYTVGSAPTRVTAVDLDGDGILDLVAANYMSNNVSVLKGKGDGTFRQAMNFATGADPNTVVHGRFGEAFPALAVVEPGQNTVGILLQTRVAKRP
jgi:hypothetical protein